VHPLQQAGSPVDGDTARQLAADLYRALGDGDRERLDQLLHPQFEGRVTAGLPLGLGGSYHGPAAMRREFWRPIAQSFAARAEPDSFGLLDDGRLLVTGRYAGHARASGGVLDAEFTHVLSFADGRISGLVQLTDSERWHQALAGDQPAAGSSPDGPGPGGLGTGGPGTGGLRTVEFSVQDGVGVLRLNRPAARNALDQAMADDLLEVAQRCAASSGLRALLLAGNGPAFTVGGDISVFAGPGELPGTLRRMTTPYHQALQTLASLDAPIVAAVHGAVAGGGLGLLYVADIALAAEGTRFATGFAGLGLSGDGGGTWFLPRLVGPRRAAELYLDQRVLDAREAAEWGLVSRVVPADTLQDEAMAVAHRLAQGPTRAYGEIRKLLRGSWSAPLPDQLAAEIEAIARTAATSDATGAVASFIGKSSPAFQGR
jgi:2-(1,2-epoxy-1,2-dihydrophenyl)acetyl-CoA isomerase